MSDVCLFVGVQCCAQHLDTFSNVDSHFETLVPAWVFVLIPVDMNEVWCRLRRLWQRRHASYRLSKRGFPFCLCWSRLRNTQESPATSEQWKAQDRRRMWRVQKVTGLKCISPGVSSKAVCLVCNKHVAATTPAFTSRQNTQRQRKHSND